MLLYKLHIKRLVLALVAIFMTAPLFGLPANISQAIRAFDQQEFEKAQSQVDEVLQNAKYKNQPNIWYYRGVIYDQLMRKNITSDSASNYLEEALKSYHKVIDLSKKRSQYHSFAQINLHALWTYYLNRSAQYYKVEAFEEALEQLSICNLVDDSAPQTLLYTAIVAHQDEQYKAALQQYKKYIEYGHAESIVYCAFANLTANYLKDEETAFEVLQQGIQKYPWDVDLLAEKHHLSLQADQLEAWQVQLLTSIKEIQANPIAHYQLAYLYTQTEEYEKALIHYQRAFELAPKQLEPITQLAKLHYNQGAIIIKNIAEMDEEVFQRTGKEAIEILNRCLKKSLHYFKIAHKLSPKSLPTLKSLHTLYIRLDKVDKGNKIARKMKQIKGGLQLLELE
jgi:tetratricopeptide (TPR) repeat protein